MPSTTSQAISTVTDTSLKASLTKKDPGWFDVTFILLHAIIESECLLMIKWQQNVALLTIGLFILPHRGVRVVT